MKIKHSFKIFLALGIIFSVSIINFSAKARTCSEMVARFNSKIKAESDNVLVFSPYSNKMHERLGVSPGASDEEVTKAYKRVVQSFHPDKFSDPRDKKEVTAIFKKIKEARNKLLKNKSKGDAEGKYVYPDKIYEHCEECSGYMLTADQRVNAHKFWKDLTQEFLEEVKIPKEYDNINYKTDYDTLMLYMQRGFDILPERIKTDKRTLKIQGLDGPFYRTSYYAFKLPSGVQIFAGEAEKIFVHMWRNGRTDFVMDYIEFHLDGMFKKIRNPNLLSGRVDYWYVVDRAISLLLLNLKKDPTRIHYYKFFTDLVKWTANSSGPYKKRIGARPQSLLTVLFGLREVIEKYKGLPHEGRQLLEEIVTGPYTWKSGKGEVYENHTLAVKIEADNLLSLLQQYSREGYNPYPRKVEPLRIPQSKSSK